MLPQGRNRLRGRNVPTRQPLDTNVEIKMVAQITLFSREPVTSTHKFSLSLSLIRVPSPGVDLRRKPPSCDLHPCIAIEGRMKKRGLTDPISLKSFSAKPVLRVVIETPKGSRNLRRDLISQILCFYFYVEARCKVCCGNSMRRSRWTATILQKIDNRVGDAEYSLRLSRKFEFTS